MELLKELLKRKLITKKDYVSLEYEIKNSQRREEEVILEKGLVSEEVLFSLKSKLLKIPLREPSIEEINNITLDTLKLIPEESVVTYNMVPLSKRGDVLEVGMVYPEDIKAKEALRFIISAHDLSSKIFLIKPSTFREILRKYRSLKREVGAALEELKTETSKKATAKEKELERIVEEAPISKIVAVTLRHAVEGNASDIHIEPLRTKLRIRFRLDGVLHSSLLLPRRVHPAIVTRIKILSNLKIDETRIPQDGRFSTEVEDRNIDFRVSTFPTPFGEKAVIRVLDPKVGLRSFEEIGFNERDFSVVKEAIKKPYGLILATGPTGCGKTTTLYAILRILNKEEVNIVTLEDPVEYFIEGVNQSQIKPEIGYTFSRGLRHILRQDPDIIMVGEIRDSETAELAIHAALTGHIVLSTLHTNDAIGAIPRLIDLGVRPFLLPSALNIVIAQRLVRRLCSYCKKEEKAKKEEEKIIMEEFRELPSEMKKKVKIKSPLKIYKAKGCSKCMNKGYSGRIAVTEVLKMTDSLADIILKGASPEEIKKEAKKQGMITMKQDGILKVLSGITSLEEVLRATEE